MSGGLGWAMVAAAGLFLLIISQPLGRPRPSLADRLAALAPDAPDPGPTAMVFSAPALDAAFGPLVRATGSALLALAELIGFRTARLARRLTLAGQPADPALWFGEKLLGGLLGLTLLPVLNLVGIHPFGPWPVWAWLATAVLGFLAPDLRLRAAIARRQQELRAGLNAGIEFLVLAVAAGCGLEQAIAEVAAASTGPFFDELRQRLARARLDGRRGTDAITDLADELGLEELATLAGALAAGARQGTPVLQTLQAQVATARERHRLALLEAGERAKVVMLFPIVLLILPAFFLLVLYPAVVNLLRLSSV